MAWAVGPGVLAMSACAGAAAGRKPATAPLASTAVEAGEQPESFQAQLTARAPRIEVELHAALGEFYPRRAPAEIAAVKKALARDGHFAGFGHGYDFGNPLWRVTTPAEARQRLAGAGWAAAAFAPESALARCFKRYPSATVALMEADDPQVLFFDREGRLAEVYPAGKNEDGRTTKGGKERQQGS